MRAEITIHTETQAETAALFAALSGVQFSEVKTASYVNSAPGETTSWSNPVNVPTDAGKQTETNEVTARRTRGPNKKNATPELAPEGSPSPTNTGPSVDLNAALDAAGAVDLTTATRPPVEEIARQVDDALLASMLGDTPPAAEKVPEDEKLSMKAAAPAAKTIEGTGVVPDESSNIEDLRLLMRNGVLTLGGKWLREVLAEAKVSRISDLSKEQILKALATPKPAG